MDAIIGRYRVCIEEDKLIIKHRVGINFDLTVNEAFGLLDFLNAYRQTLMTLQRDTDPYKEQMREEENDS